MDNNTSAAVGASTSGVAVGVVSGTSQRIRRVQDVGISQPSTSTLLHSDSTDNKLGIKPHKRRNIWQHLGLMLLNRRWGSLFFVALIMIAVAISLISLFQVPQSLPPTWASKLSQKTLKTSKKESNLDEEKSKTPVVNGLSQSQKSNSLVFEPTEVDIKYGLSVITGSMINRSSPIRSGPGQSSFYYPAIDLTTIISKEEAMQFLIGMAVGFGIGDDVTYGEDINEGVSIPSVTSHLTQQSLPSGRASIRPDLAVLTRRGYKGGLPQLQVNQDRLVIQTAFGDRSSNDFFLGLFDGHGENGHKVAHFAHLNMPKLLEDEIGSKSKQQQLAYNDETTMKQILEGAFVEIDRTLPNLPGSGCTAHTILRLGDTIYASNAGDSRILIAYYIPSLRVTTVIYRNALHKPNTPSERTRIESNGGMVLAPPPNIRLATSRVLVIVGMMQIGLAMSRSIGDHEARNVGVIANPVMDVIHIGEELDKIQKAHGLSSKDEIKLFAVAGSDGIMELLPEQHIVSNVSQSLFASSTSKFLTPEKSLLDTIQDLIMSASAEWMTMSQPYRDDISLAAIEIKT